MFLSPVFSTPAQAGVQLPRISRWRSALHLAAARTWAPAFAGVVLSCSTSAYAQSAPQPLPGPPACGDVPADICDLGHSLTPDDPGYSDVDPVAQRLPIIVTATRAPQQPWQIGQAVTVIERADLDRRQSVAVSDILATTPGVTVARNGSVGGFTGVRLRGAEAEQTLVVIDGIRVNDPSSPGGGFDFANLLAASVDRIEVLRGPNSVPWGSQAIGGVVNVITADPSRLAEGVVLARAKGEYGYADQVYTTAGLEGRTGIVSGGLAGGYLRTDGISAAANGRERDGYRQYGASGRLAVAFTDTVGVDLRGYWADSRTRLDGTPPPTYALTDTAEYSTAQELYGYAGLHADIGRLANRVAFTIADIDRDNFDPAVGATPVFFGRGRSERYEYQGDWRPLDAIRLVAGAEREDSRFDDGDTGADTGITSVYGQLIAQPLDGVTLTGGLRYDDHDAFGEHTTAGADAAWRIGRTTLRASYGEGFKAPTLFQLYGFVGEPTLEPETARSFDLGVEQRLLGNAVTARATYFNRRTRNQIDFDLTTFTYANIARTRAEGVEAELALHPVERLTLTANYTYLRARNRSAGANFGRDLARRPRETASVDADYRFPFGLAVGGTLLIVGDSFDNAGNSVRLDGYALASVRAELPVGEKLSVYGRIENVGQERYRTVANYGTYPRAAYAGVRVKLD